MLDELDDGARIGVWTVLGVVALLLFGLLGGLVVRQLGERKAAAPVAVARPAALAVATAPMAAPVAAPVAIAPAAQTETVLDEPLAGELIGTLYFDSGASALSPGEADSLKALAAKLQGAAPRRVVLSGFHDATGDPAMNYELARERSKAVREALKAAGVVADRIALRRPESTTGDGTNKEARRVEVRLMPK